MPYELRLKAQHSCPFLKFAGAFSAPVHSYCTREFDIMEVREEVTKAHRELLQELFPNDASWEVISSGSTWYVRMHCLCETLYETSVTSMIQQAGGMLEYPIRYIDGFEYHKVRCLNESALSQVIKEVEQLPYLEVIAIEDLGEIGFYKSQMISAFELLNELTPTQLRVLVDAFKGGYYAIPRQVRTKDLAEAYQISRYAVDKSLRKAENKIIEAIIPYLLFQSRPTS